MLKSVRVGHWILYRGNAQFRLSISLPVTASDHEVKAAFLTRTGQRETGAAAALWGRREGLAEAAGFDYSAGSATLVSRWEIPALWSKQSRYR
jgi:hypothetical protein